VERVEGFASEAEWRRAYSEINEFEEQLVENGAILLMFWLQVSDEEQLHRFQDREDTPYKRYKITDEDWRNREKWPEYKSAVNEMVARTSTEHAPWTLVEGDDKPYARVKILRAICEALKNALKTEQVPISGYLPCGDRRPDVTEGATAPKGSPGPSGKSADKEDRDEGNKKGAKGDKPEKTDKSKD
jgi:hypothetical protein